jgi:hypothetical protein
MANTPITGPATSARTAPPNLESPPPGITQYIILNLQTNSVHIHTHPDPAAATYRTQTSATPGQALALTLPNDQHLTVLVSDILPR